MKILTKIENPKSERKKVHTKTRESVNDSRS